ncbi:MAG: hypothetical protein P8185_25495, partial [Deltaproteobacteria bacterium]
WVSDIFNRSYYFFGYDQQDCGIDKIVGTESVSYYTWVGLSKIAVKIFNVAIKCFNSITPLGHGPKKLRPEGMLG